MNIQEKLSALRRADAETEKKIQELYPADWDMEKIFQKSYKKYQQQVHSDKVDAAGENGSQTGENRRRKIQIHINRYVTAACLILTAGIAGAVGYMQLSMQKPSVIMPPEPAETTFALHEVQPDASQTAPLLTSPAPEQSDDYFVESRPAANTEPNKTTVTMTVSDRAGTEKQNTQSPSGTDAAVKPADGTEPPSASEVTVNAAKTTVPKTHTTAAPKTTAKTKATTAKTTTAKTKTTTAKATTAPVKHTTAKATTAPVKHTTARPTTAAAKHTTTRPSTAASPQQTMTSLPLQTAAQSPWNTEPTPVQTKPVGEPPENPGGELPSTGEKGEPNEHPAGFELTENPDSPDTEKILRYWFASDYKYPNPTFEVDSDEYTVYADDPSDYHIIHNASGTVINAAFYSGETFQTVVDTIWGSVSEVRVQTRQSYFVWTPDYAALYWFDGTYLCEIRTDNQHISELYYISERLYTNW